jgi:hypothetical protein
MLENMTLLITKTEENSKETDAESSKKVDLEAFFALYVKQKCENETFIWGHHEMYEHF